MIVSLTTLPQHPHLSPSDIEAVADLAFDVGRCQSDPEARASLLLSGIRDMVAADGVALFYGEIRDGVRSLRHGRWNLHDNWSVAVGRDRGRTGGGECGSGIWVESIMEAEGCAHVHVVGRTGRVFYLISQRDTPEGQPQATIAVRRSSSPFAAAERLLLRAIHGSAVGRLLTVVRPEGAKAVSGGTGEPQLTPRVRQVLAGLKEGRTEKELAAALRISRHTVHAYVKRIYRDYHVSSRGELLNRWIRD